MNRLRKQFEVVTKGAGALKDFYSCGLAAEKNDTSGRAEFANGNGGLDAVEVGHGNVRKNSVGLKTASGFHGIAAVVAGEGLKAVPVQDLYECVGDDRLVVDDEDRRDALFQEMAGDCTNRKAWTGRLF
jgi:hypothetical protein